MKILILKIFYLLPCVCAMYMCVNGNKCIFYSQIVYLLYICTECKILILKNNGNIDIENILFTSMCVCVCLYMCVNGNKCIFYSQIL